MKKFKLINNYYWKNKLSIFGSFIVFFIISLMVNINIYDSKPTINNQVIFKNFDNKRKSLKIDNENINSNKYPLNNKAKIDRIQSINYSKLTKQVLQEIEKSFIVNKKDKAILIASRIKNLINIKEELGMDLTNLAKTSKYSIFAEGFATGKISISISMITIGATKQLSNLLLFNVWQKSDIDLQNQEIVDNEKTRIENLDNYTINKNVTIIRENNLKIAELNLDLKNNNLKYTVIHNQFTKKGNYIVKIKIEKDSQIAIANRRIIITGMDADNQQAVDNEKIRIEALERIIINKSLTSIPSNSLLVNEMDLKSLTNQFSYSIIHNPFNSDGNYNASIRIKKNNKFVFAKRKISIIGINNTNRNNALKESKDLLKGKIIGIASGSLITIISLSIIILKIFKNKKNKYLKK